MNIEEINNKNIGVSCTTKEDAEAFLRIAHQMGYHWSSGTSLIRNSNWEYYKHNTYYCIENDVFYYGNLRNINPERKVIDCSEFLTARNLPEPYPVSAELDSFLNSFLIKQ